ncbi:hypothetical protein KM043_011219 [Ampulex compressa]|nr:hypothetical protein KM043_011219 [Ampulex compressa]
MPLDTVGYRSVRGTLLEAGGDLGLSGPVVAALESYWPAKSQVISSARRNKGAIKVHTPEDGSPAIFVERSAVPLFKYPAPREFLSAPVAPQPPAMRCDVQHMLHRGPNTPLECPESIRVVDAENGMREP